MAAQTALHLVLALAWVVLSDEVNLKNLVIGYVVGGIVLWFYQRTRGESLYLTRVWSAFKLFLLLLYEQVKSNIEVASLVLSPRLSIRPGIVAVPLEVETDAEITAVANMITLTPGTLSVDVTEDRKTLFVHVINLDDPNTEPQALLKTKARFERLVAEVTRG